MDDGSRACMHGADESLAAAGRTVVCTIWCNLALVWRRTRRLCGGTGRRLANGTQVQEGDLQH